MPAGMGEEERFAAAVENGTTPASADRGSGSPNAFARELEIVGLLRSGGPAFGPEPAARDQAKRRLMAAFAQEFAHDPGDNATDATGPLQVLAPVALAERETRRVTEPAPLRRAPHRAGRHSAPEPDPVEEPDAPGADDAPELGNVRRLGSTRGRAPQRRGHHRAAVLGAAAAAALVALAGGGTFASRGALPGDPMYGVKRVAEQTSYALTFGEQAKARRHLEQAQHRLDEVEGLTTRSRTAKASGSAAAKSDPDLVRSTMQEFDADTTEGSRQLLAGPTPPDTKQVDEVRTWATKQSERLSGIRSTLPAPDRADSSLALLQQVLGETEALQGASCQPGASGSAGSSTSSSGGSATAAASADGDCGSARAAATPEPAGTATTPEPDEGTRASAGTSARTRSDDGDAHSDGATDGDVSSDTGTDVSTDGDDTSAGTSNRGSASTGGDDRRRRDGSGGGSSGSGSSGGGGGAGAQNLDVPLPVPATVDVPSVGGLPGVRLG